MEKEVSKEEVTVVVPVRNRENLVAETLDSVSGQTWRPLHLVVVDNGSEDSTLETVRKWKADNESNGFRVTVVSEEKPGASAARNRGMEECTGDKLMFFDSDDVMYPGLVESAMEAFRNDAECGMVVWKRQLKSIDGRVSVSKGSHPEVGKIQERQMVDSVLATQCYMAKVSLFREAGGWDENLPVWNDLELGMRLLSLNPRIIVLEKVLAEVRSREDSITGVRCSDKAGDWEKSLEAMERRYCGDAGIVRMCAYRRVILAAHYKREGKAGLAAEAYRSAIEKCVTAGGEKWVLRLAYAYTAAGGRGAWHFCRKFLLN